MAELFFGWVAPERRLLLFQGTEKKTKPMTMGELDTILFFPDATLGILAHLLRMVSCSLKYVAFWR